MIKRILILPIFILMTGCAALPAAMSSSSTFGISLPPIGAQPSFQTLAATSVMLKKRNYRIVRADAIGESTGFSLLGLFSFRQPMYTEAMSRLYQKAEISEGKAFAVVNVAHQQSSTYFILFSLPKITIRADVIEFVDGEAKEEMTSEPPEEQPLTPAESF